MRWFSLWCSQAATQKALNTLAACQQLQPSAELVVGVELILLITFLSLSPFLWLSYKCGFRFLTLGEFKLLQGYMRSLLGSDSITKRSESVQPTVGVTRLHGNRRASITLRSDHCDVEDVAIKQACCGNLLSWSLKSNLKLVFTEVSRVYCVLLLFFFFFSPINSTSADIKELRRPHYSGTTPFGLFLCLTVMREDRHSTDTRSFLFNGC